jgi:uncharacterized membrane protein
MNSVSSFCEKLNNAPRAVKATRRTLMSTESSRSFESNKVLCGVGAILAAIGSIIPISSSVGIVYIIGATLILIGMRGLAEDLRENTIFTNVLYGFIFSVIGIIGGIIAYTVFVAPIFTGLTFFRVVVHVLLGFAALAIILVFFVFSAIFLKRAFDLTEAKTGERILRTGGLLLLIGAVLIIAFGLGFIFLFIAWILIAIGLFSMRPPAQLNPPQPITPMNPGPSIAPQGTVKYCPYCGAENRLESTFCTHCGRRST